MIHSLPNFARSNLVRCLYHKALCFNIKPFSLKHWHFKRSFITTNKKFTKMTEFCYPNHQTVGVVDCESAFCALTEKEKLYAHYLSRASWYGGLIILFQTSAESPLIYVLLTKVFHEESISDLKEKALSQCEFTDDDFIAFLVYTACILGNMGNYKAFGDTKFIPNLPKEKFFKLILISKAAISRPKEIKTLLNNCGEKIYSLLDGERQLGFPDIGVTTYLSKNVTQEDREIVKEFMKKKNFEACNSRLFKTQDETGRACYEIRLASILSTEDAEDCNFIATHMDNGHKFVFTRGDYSKILQLVNENLLKAKEYAANETEVQMIEKYIHSFKTGSLDAHKDGSRFWIRDKGPIIESYIGFIETYRDPEGIRAEFEGFVAVVNKPMSKKFEALVDKADIFLPLLPWPSTYENKVMIKPDFTSLDVLSFSCSEIPAGICIPNYSEIRSKEGFKNVSLGNIIIASVKGTTPNHLSKEDVSLFERCYVQSSEISVGLHEFLGHGSGKMFKIVKGSFNFEDDVIDLETQNKITSWYKEGETYDSVFSSLSSTFEECRAEAVALYLSTYPEVLKVFGFEDQKSSEEILYVSWLCLLYAGVKGLYVFEPKTNSWLQAHAQARFALLQVCLEAGDDFIQIKEITGEDGKPDFIFSLDRTKILSIGKPAIGVFLQKLQLYRATANVAKAYEMYNKYTAVTNSGKYPFLKLRDIIIARKKPRKILVQANTVIEDGKVKLNTYEGSAEGMIKSFLDRFETNEVDEILKELWQKDFKYFI